MVSGFQTTESVGTLSLETTETSHLTCSYHGTNVRKFQEQIKHLITTLDSCYAKEKPENPLRKELKRYTASF